MPFDDLTKKETYALSLTLFGIACIFLYAAASLTILNTPKTTEIKVFQVAHHDNHSTVIDTYGKGTMKFTGKRTPPEEKKDAQPADDQDDKADAADSASTPSESTSNAETATNDQPSNQ